MNVDKLHEWMVTHNTGVSSKTMWGALLGISIEKSAVRLYHYDVPYDADDFSRCYDLVKFCEVDKEKDFPLIISSFLFFAPIIRRWDELETKYLERDYMGINEILRSVRPEVVYLRNVWLNRR